MNNFFKRTMLALIFVIPICSVNAQEKCIGEVCDQIVFSKKNIETFTSLPIRGSVMDIRWAGENTVIVKAINTVSGYTLKNGVFQNYFQHEMSESGNIDVSDIAISNNEKWLAIAENNKIRIIDLKDGSLILVRNLKKNGQITAMSFVDPSLRPVSISDVASNNPFLAYAYTIQGKSDIYMSKLIPIGSKELENCGGNRVCGTHGDGKQYEYKITKNPLDFTVQQIEVIRGHFSDIGAGLEALFQTQGCESQYYISMARDDSIGQVGNIQKLNTLLPCRRYNYPTSGYSIDFLSDPKFPFPNDDKASFTSVNSKAKIPILIAVGTSDKCPEGVLIDQYKSINNKWATENLKCFKGPYAGREVTAIKFSKYGKYIAVGGADKEISILDYKTGKEVKIE